MARAPVVLPAVDDRPLLYGDAAVAQIRAQLGGIEFHINPPYEHWTKILLPLRRLRRYFVRPQTIDEKA